MLLAACPIHAQAPDDAAAWWKHYRADARLVRLPDGKRLSLYCEGKGAPVVMMESGLGSGAWTWHKVQTAIARTTRTCVYDRAGYWSSPPAGGPRDAGAEADDLAALLKAAQLPAPYVIVGHSYGGYITRLYAGRHTADLAGLVLVDPSSARQNQRLGEISPAMASSEDAGVAKTKACSIDPRPPGDAKDCVLRPPPKDIPPDMADWFIASQTPGYASAMAREYDAMPALSSDQLNAEKKSLGAVPFVLLNRDNERLVTDGPPQEEAANALWLKMHQEIMDISSDSQLRIVAGAGHRIQDDKPAAVIEAVIEVVAKARKEH
jgi:pimeloyl-ACP methyl ester carboxylesterase